MPTPRRECSPSPCTRVREGLSGYDYGGPGWWQRRQISRHLSHCRECMAELASLRRAAALLDALPEERAPSGLWERLEEELDRAVRAPGSRPRSARRVPALVAAGVTAALAVGLGFRRSHDVPEEPPAASDGRYVRSHLALSIADPLAPGAGLDVLALGESGKAER